MDLSHPYPPADRNDAFDHDRLHEGDDDRRSHRLDAACRQACATIAPAWPLDRAIAVNPYWKRTALPLRTVAARMAVLAGIQVLPTRERLREAWHAGELTREDVARAIAQQAADADDAPATAALTPEAWWQAVQHDVVLPRLPLLIDVLDDDAHRHHRLSWREAITHQVGQTCAAYFDELQGEWRPESRQGLYAFWRETLQHDHGIGVLMGLPELGARARALPARREAAEAWVMLRLGLPQAVWADYLEAVLLTVNGWASWCAYLDWQAGLAGGEDLHLRELLALRLAWGVLVLGDARDEGVHPAFATLQAAWARATETFAEAEALLRVDEIGQRALDIACQRGLARSLDAADGARAAIEAFAASPADPAADSQTAGVEAQAAFCIDVRSEPLRRALETVAPGVQTLGFAGFFGLPIAYTPLGTCVRRPQLPGLLAPAMDVTEVVVDAGGASRDAGAVADRRRARLARSETLQALRRWPATAFSFVEAAGVGYLGKLGGWLRPGTQARPRDDFAGLSAREQAHCRPQLSGLDTAAQAALARQVLQTMGIADRCAPLVVLVGHGSQSDNNAHAAALDCGACCGQTGEVNARALARLLNDQAVRAALRADGFAIPDESHFVAALHNTTTDEIEAFDLDLLPAEARARWMRLQAAFERAGDRVRRERAPGLDAALGARLDTLSADALRLALRRRANDGAQTRPEWGLAGNAAFVIAPRARTRGAMLAGRSFLHDYDPAQDADGRVLELLMTAPMVVTHWINWQYHASTCDPLRMGSGNKLLHNVVGGDLGVFEGNGGDLRIGLSRQSLHDGTRWRHDPVRLTVVIDAPTERIASVLRAHPQVAALVDNGWLHLWRFGAHGRERYVRGVWHDVD